MTGYIPPATADKLAAPIPEGHRHNTCKDIAISLIGEGWPENEVRAILRSKITDVQTFPDREIDNIIRWAVSKSPTPSDGNKHASEFTHTRPTYKRHQPAPDPGPKFQTPVEWVEWWTNGDRISPEAMAARSPITIPPHRSEALILFLSSLYADHERMNLVAKFCIDGAKAKPIGSGRVQTRDEWISYVKTEGVPESQAGCWFRMNPCAAVGSGEGGAITDADITSHRFMLLESDALPVEMQLALFYRLKLPVAAVIMSGGNSAHAWVKVGACDGKRYSEVVARLLASLEKFGIDKANKNASRLSRCPGAIRVVGATGDGLQRLVWLNPNAGTITDEIIREFEQSLQFPAIEEEPLRALARASLDRYDYLLTHRGQLGIPFGVPALDYESGGLKAGQTLVVAGQTGQGKSTYALHMIKATLKRSIGVLLFSLEMDKEEIFDLLVSDYCNINRNKFNNGEFSEYDQQLMQAGLPEIAKFPLYIEDSPMMNVEQVGVRAHQLKAAKKIGLVVVDYIQFMNPSLTRDVSREQQVATISHALRAMARETKLPFVVLSQLNDEGRLRESRVIAHNANIVATVSSNEDIFTVDIVKGRGIRKGNYKLDYIPNFARLASATPPTPTQYPD